MALTLHYHPLSSFCHKVLSALYEQGTPFRSEIVKLGDPDGRTAFLALSPLGKMPVLRDSARDRTVPETTIIIEYLERHYPGAEPLLPREPGARLEARFWDRFFDLYVHVHMQKIVGDRFRPEGERDPRGVADARAALNKAYEIIEQRMSGRTWAVGEHFTMADCAATPALFYGGIVEPFDKGRVHLNAYFERLMTRASAKRVIDEARPFFEWFPFKEAIPKRFL